MSACMNHVFGDEQELIVAKIFDFKRRTVTEIAEIPEGRSASGTRAAGGKPKVDKETYLLWLFSRDVDILISKFILEHKLSAKEVAAVLAHRLGQLIAGTPDKRLLVPFCQKVIARVSGIPKDESKEDNNGRGAS
jgi:hypothetical protein